jgi:hypothetical protein
MARGGGRQPKNRPQKVAKAGVKREEGFLYFIDKRGDICKTKMARRGGRKRKAARGAAPRRRKSSARRPARRTIRRTTARRRTARRRR